MIPVDGIHAEIHQLTSWTFLMSRNILRETMTCPCTTPPTEMLPISCTSSKSSDLFIWKCPACKSFKNIRTDSVLFSQQSSPLNHLHPTEITDLRSPQLHRNLPKRGKGGPPSEVTLNSFTQTMPRCSLSSLGLVAGPISKSTFYFNKAITEFHIVKPEVSQQEVHSAITNNLQLSEFSLRCKEVFVSYKDELKALKKANLRYSNCIDTFLYSIISINCLFLEFLHN